MTPDDILKAFITLESAGIRRPDTMAPTVEALDATAELWADLLSDMTPAQLAAAVKTHLRHPERGRFWPTPADLRNAAGATAAALPNPDEAAWQIIVNAPRTAELYHRLDPAQRHALALVGRWEITRAEGDMARGALRKRFLSACESYRASELRAIEGGKAGELPDNVRQMVRGVLQ